MENTWTDRDIALFITACFALALYALTEATILLAVIMALGLLCIIPAILLRRMMGYIIITDVAFSMWLVGVASTTFAGLTVAAMAGLIYSLGSREILAAGGSEELAINRKTAFGEQLAELAEQGVAWGKALVAGLKSGKVVAPTAMQFEWVEKEEAGGFKATLTYATGKKLFGKARDLVSKWTDRAIEVANT